MKKTYYEALGVPHDATPEDIKQAFRAQRGALHPDREGGDTEAMAALNAAYTVLSDAELRAKYDASLPDVERDARQHAEQVMTTALDSDDDPIEVACTMVEETIFKVETACAATEKKLARLRKHLKRVKFKGQGKDAVSALIERQISAAQEQLEGIEHADEVLRRALILLSDYDYELPEQPQPSESDRILSELARAHMAFAAAPYPFFRTGT